MPSTLVSTVGILGEAVPGVAQSVTCDKARDQPRTAEIAPPIFPCSARGDRFPSDGGVVTGSFQLRFG